MTPQDKKDLKKTHDLMKDFEEKGSYLLTLEMFKNFHELFYNPEDEDECN